MPLKDHEYADLRAEQDARVERLRTSGVLAKPVKVVLIGTDCTGKTELATRLRMYYGVTAISNRRIPGDLSSIAEVIDFALYSMPNTRFVLDQWQFPVDIVYRATLDNETSPIAHIAHLLIPHLKELDVLFIHLDARDEVLAERFAVRGDELWTLPQIQNVAAGYRMYLPQSGIQYQTINTSDLTKEEVFNRAKILINTHYLRSGKNESSSSS